MIPRHTSLWTGADRDPGASIGARDSGNLPAASARSVPCAVGRPTEEGVRQADYRAPRSGSDSA